MIIVGIDPDGNKHGVAIYVNRVLERLQMWDTIEIVTWLQSQEMRGKKIKFSIENVVKQKFSYGRNTGHGARVDRNIAMKVGKCQQAQTELMRWLDHLKIEYELHAPQRGNWAKNKEQFELCTKWKERSNPDTRSAAFFGFLATRS